MRDKWQCDRHAAEKRDELAPPHDWPPRYREGSSALLAAKGLNSPVNRSWPAPMIDGLFAFAPWSNDGAVPGAWRRTRPRPRDAHARSNRESHWRLRGEGRVVEKAEEGAA